MKQSAAGVERTSCGHPRQLRLGVNWLEKCERSYGFCVGRIDTSLIKLCGAWVRIIATV
jgi:hypothetical protein